MMRIEFKDGKLVIVGTLPSEAAFLGAAIDRLSEQGLEVSGDVTFEPEPDEATLTIDLKKIRERVALEIAIDYLQKRKSEL